MTKKVFFYINLCWGLRGHAGSDTCRTRSREVLDSSVDVTFGPLFISPEVGVDPSFRVHGAQEEGKPAPVLAVPWLAVKRKARRGRHNKAGATWTATATNTRLCPKVLLATGFR